MSDVIDVAARDETTSLIHTSSGPVDVSSVVGWGVDANPQNDPTYSYRDRSQDDHNGEWKRPPLQKPSVEILSSIEHVRLPAVFGESSPPRGLSGMMRRAAFSWSESNWAHWLLLIGADRVNMIEGLAADLAHGTIPNIPKEMGVRAEWKHNKSGLATKIAVAAALGAGIYAFRGRRRRKSGGSAEAPAEGEQEAAS